MRHPRAMMVTSPAPDVYQVHERRQRPVEGADVYRTAGTLVCKRCDDLMYPGYTAHRSCVHVEIVKIVESES